ncbi:Na-translocating system protein MpsC family protein [Fredinandcohnia onubensis]|uniref:Na-translocating system protein MpsC family protein n=1 Tax=Fredinandcohnia onubensis TaxID=1571209 RepID=UPI000C0BECE5|nr:Na-translocating system protein MpsC family protein [Fredinandcohnia onubensis]
MDLQGKLKYISSYTSKLLRNKFGRGPESCFAVTANHFLVLQIRGFISPMEEVLLQENQRIQVDHARDVVIKSILAELKGVFQVTLETEVKTFFHDWNFPNNTGVIIAELESPLNQMEKDKAIDFALLESEIDRISKLVQKIPEKTSSFQISPRIFIVKRDGILVPIEKALLKRGFEKELLFTKDNLEKSYLHRHGKYEQIFSQPVADIFVDWDFKEDNSLICFILK